MGIHGRQLSLFLVLLSFSTAIATGIDRGFGAWVKYLDSLRHTDRYSYLEELDALLREQPGFFHAYHSLPLPRPRPTPSNAEEKSEEREYTPQFLPSTNTEGKKTTRDNPNRFLTRNELLHPKIVRLTEILNHPRRQRPEIQWWSTPI